VVTPRQKRQVRNYPQGSALLDSHRPQVGIALSEIRPE
jgi:hypothetical protein